MRPLTIGEVLVLHRLVIAQAGGASGVRDRGALESAVGQPLATFAGAPLYPDVIDRAAALAFFLVSNHPFVDGNKRTGHAAMEACLMLNGYEVHCGVDEQERMFLSLAAGEVSREVLTQWLRDHAVPHSAA